MWWDAQVGGCLGVAGNSQNRMSRIDGKYPLRFKAWKRNWWESWWMERECGGVISVLAAFSMSWHQYGLSPQFIHVHFEIAMIE